MMIRARVGTLVAMLLFSAIFAFAAESSGEKEVLATIETWKQAVMKRDKSTLEKVLHPDLTYGHSSGIVETKEQQIRHMIQSKATYEAISTSDTRVHMYGNVALVDTKMEYRQNTAGKIEIVKMQVLMAWLKGSDGWQMIGRQSTRPDSK